MLEHKTRLRLMSGIFIAVFMTASFLPVHSVFAETVLTIEDAIEIALEQGFEMKSHRLSLIQAEQNSLAAKYRFRTNIDMNLNTPNWREDVREVPVANALPVYNSLGTLRYQGSLNINQPLPTNGRISLRSQLYQSQESNFFTETDKTLKRKDFFSSFRLYFDQPLFTYNRIKTDLKQAELSYERSSLTLKRGKLDVVYNVTNAFFALYSAQRSFEISNETMEQQNLQYETARQKYEAGLIPEVDALRFEVDLATAQANYFETETNLTRQEETFKQLVGIDLAADISVKSDTNYKHVILDLENAVRIGLRNRTELRESEISIEMNKIGVVEADSRSEVSANLSAYYDLSGRSNPELPYGSSTGSLFESSIDDLERRPGNRGVSLVFNIPIWDWGVNKAQVASAKANLKRSELQHEETKKGIITSVSDAVRQVQSAENRLGVLEKSQIVAQRAYDINLERFNNGGITSIELAKDNESLLNSKLSYLGAYISYKLSLADLKRKTFWDFELDRPLVD